MNYTHIQLAPDDEDNEVWIYYGLAAYYAQLLEKDVLQFVAMLEFVGLSSIGPGTTQQIFARLDRHTLGQLMRAARTRATIPQHIDDLLSESLEKRNFLIHKFYYHHGLSHLSEAGRRMMVDELQRMAALFKRTDKELETIFLPLAAQLGITEDVLERQYHQLLAEWEDPIAAI